MRPRVRSRRRECVCTYVRVCVSVFQWELVRLCIRACKCVCEFMCVRCVRERESSCVREFVGEFERACMRVFVSACVYMCVCLSAFVRVCVSA